MSNNQFQSNFQNKSDLIRTVYKSNPTATNLMIREIVKKTFGVDVNSNLIIAAIGKHKTRIALKNPSHLLDLAAKFLREFGNDLGWAFYWLKRAA